MTTSCLSQIIGTAIIDDSFRNTLLSNPQHALAQFELEANELRDISSIQATTIEQFAEKLLVWMNGRKIEWA